MHRIVLFVALVSTVSTGSLAQKVTGLSGWSIYLDPGHSRLENMGVFGYSEAEKNVRVALALRDLLLERTDIDTVYMSRTNDQVQVSLTQRVDHANLVGADHFHSIHSNAAAPTVNHVFVLWPQYRDGTEAIPNGGRRMAEIMSALLGRGMRIESQGGIGECDFYGVASCRSRDAGGKGGSRNFVQSFTIMASDLSEAGFHTNPTQNQRNMNADWNRLEAQAMFWAILAFHGIERPPERIVTGIISDVENDRPINGALVTLGDTTYVTDTFESLFSTFSNNPHLLRNGFFYLDGVDQPTVPISVQAEGFDTLEGTVVVSDSFFTFADVQLVSTVPPIVASTSPVHGEERFRITDPIVIDFSRKMEPSSVELAFSMSPPTDGQFTWSQGDMRMTFRPDSLQPETVYVLRIEDSARGIFGHSLDGDADGEEGGGFELTFRSGAPDAFPPVLVDGFPLPQQTDVPVHPILTYTFDEALDPTSIAHELFSLAPSAGGSPMSGQLTYDLVSDQGVITYFPDEALEPGIYYTFRIEPGLSDLAGNQIEARRQVAFRTTTQSFETTPIDPFEDTVTGVWWQPQQSGSTAGIVTDSTTYGPDSSRVNFLTGSRWSRRLDYGWEPQPAASLIRVYLGGGPARDVWFDTEHILQVYLFGDGSGTRFRFALDDQTGHEVSPWMPIDWRGWRLVSWDLSEGEVGTWIGDGVLHAPLRFDSFQLSPGEGSQEFGSLWLDDLHLAKPVALTSTDNFADVPGALRLEQNYPNPFNGQTTFRFVLPSPSPVTLIVYNTLGETVAHMAEQLTLTAGAHELHWDAAGLPSGVYFARMTSAGASQTIKLVLLR